MCSEEATCISGEVLQHRPINFCVVLWIRRGSGSVILLLRIRIFAIYRRFKETQKKLITVYVQVGSVSDRIRNSVLWIRRSGSERNIYGSTTLININILSCFKGVKKHVSEIDIFEFFLGPEICCTLTSLDGCTSWTGWGIHTGKPLVNLR